MRIYVDADACPKSAKEVIFKVSDRLAIEVILVANQYMQTPASPKITSLVVGGDFNEADDKIVELVQRNDLVITADIPLADRLVKKGASVLSAHGEIFSDDNIGERLASRNLMEELRSGGLVTGGPAPYGPKDRQAFSNAFDKMVTRLLRT